jgi:tyrosyl-tRNA synthetase
MQAADIDKQLQILKRGTLEIISEEDLYKKLENSVKLKKPLRVKAGFDPTAPDIHLGHTVLLRKLRQFQDFGHMVYFLIGDFTGMIGDPSGKNEARKRLTPEEVKANAVTYQKQVFKVLDPTKTKIVYNSQWFNKLNSQGLLELSAHVTVAQLLARSDFNARYNSGRDISLLEFFYPLLQAYDSVHLESDVELGGSDQKFNLLLGRELQRDFNKEEQVVIMMPLLEGTDGVNKMSKSLGNYIGIHDEPDQIVGKVMSISDDLMYRYFELLTDEDLGEMRKLHPREAKLTLAQRLIEQYYNKASALKAREQFEKVFSRKEIPDEMPVYRLDKEEEVVSVMVKSNLVESKNEARRLIKQQAVSFNNDKVISEDCVLSGAGILKVGSRRFLKILVE